MDESQRCARRPPCERCFVRHARRTSSTSRSRACTSHAPCASQPQRQRSSPSWWRLRTRFFHSGANPFFASLLRLLDQPFQNLLIPLMGRETLSLRLALLCRDFFLRCCLLRSRLLLGHRPGGLFTGSRRRRGGSCFLLRGCCSAGCVTDRRIVDSQLALTSDRLDACQIFAQLTHFLNTARLSHLELELQTKKLVGGVALLMQKLVRTKISNFFDIHFCLVSFTRDKLSPERELVRRQAHRLLRVGLAYPFHLKEDLSRANYCDPMIRRSLAFAHTGLGGLLGYRLVGKETQPNFAAALHEARHSHTARFDLTVSNVPALQNLESVVTERELRTSPCFSGHTSALRLAVLNFFWHQHKISFPIFSY